MVWHLPGSRMSRMSPSYGDLSGEHVAKRDITQRRLLSALCWSVRVIYKHRTLHVPFYHITSTVSLLCLLVCPRQLQAQNTARSILSHYKYSLIAMSAGLSASATSTEHCTFHSITIQVVALLCLLVRLSHLQAQNTARSILSHYKYSRIAMPAGLSKSATSTEHCTFHSITIQVVSLLCLLVCPSHLQAQNTARSYPVNFTSLIVLNIR